MATTNKLPRTLTLKSRKEIDRLLKHGHRRTGSFYSLMWEFSESFRYAILLSGKIGHAVFRNRIKRLFREAIRLNRQTLKRPVHIALLVRTLANEPTLEDINREISQCFAYIESQPN
ncbi:MAG: ribonuclease P protein component [Candidatus Zixiibacteriota bacterium]